MTGSLNALSISDLGYLITLFVMNVSFEKDDTFTKNQFLEGRPQGGSGHSVTKKFSLNILSKCFLIVWYLLSLTFINPVKNNQSFTRIIDSASGLEQLQNLSYVKSSPKQIKCIQFKKYLMFINIRYSQEFTRMAMQSFFIAFCREVFFSAREIWNFCVFLFTFTFVKTSLGLPLTWTIIKIPRFGCF